MNHSALAMATLTALLCTACDNSSEPAGPAGESVNFGESDVRKVDPGKADSSAEAVIVDMAFSGELVTDSSWNLNKQIEDQLLFTIGHLNGDKAVGRLDKLRLESVVSEAAGDKTRITYKATLQVAWRKSVGVPAEYTFKLPADMTRDGQKAFTDKYNHDCVDSGAHDVDTGSMWYYFRPNARRCDLADADIITTTAAVSVSPVNTTGKYPEYHRVWEDDVFIVVAVFGKYEDGSTSNSDAGIRAWNKFSGAIRSELRPHGLEMSPSDAPESPGVAHNEITYSAKIDDNHRVVVHTLLVDNVRTAGAEFNNRYAELSGTADLIIYNGHAGLGSNIRALASKGEWQSGQYAMVFMNGCDTYAYVDSALFDAHARVNDDDDIGTKYVDLVTNAMPSFFASMSGATMALIRGLMRHDEPRTYEQIFKDIDSSQIVLVSGEEDNEYVPGFDPDGEEPTSGWNGETFSGALAAGEEFRHETVTLPAGKYSFDMTGTGDADLYVRTGLAPTATDYDCRPYRAGSAEACEIELASPATLHVMVSGYSPESTFELVASPLQ
jgi:hypothetical protein